MVVLSPPRAHAAVAYRRPRGPRLEHRRPIWIGTFDVIWQHGENKALRDNRKDPNALLPGDEIYIPDVKPKQLSVPTEKRHTIVVHRPKAKLRLVLLDALGDPIANAKGEIFDMVGSASDWTSSDLCAYPDHRCKHPEGLRVARGGRSYGFWITFRYAYDPERADPSLGIRCAADRLRPDERP